MAKLKEDEAKDDRKEEQEEEEEKIAKVKNQKEMKEEEGRGQQEVVEEDKSDKRFVKNSKEEEKEKEEKEEQKEVKEEKLKNEKGEETGQEKKEEEKRKAKKEEETEEKARQKAEDYVEENKEEEEKDEDKDEGEKEIEREEERMLMTSKKGKTGPHDESKEQEETQNENEYEGDRETRREGIETKEEEKKVLSDGKRSTENSYENKKDEEESDDDQEEDLLELAGATGRWTRRAMLLCAAVTFVVPLQAMSYQLLGGTPPHWCLPHALAEANWTPAQVHALAVPPNLTGEAAGCLMYDYNYTLAASLGFEAAMADTDSLHEGPRTTTACTARYFNATHSTTVTEWDLVCERRSLYSTTFSVSHMLRVVSCLTQGLVIDTFGRARSAVVCAALFVCCSVMAGLVQSLQAYLALRGLVAVFEHYLYVACYVLTLELCTPRQRSMAGNLFAVPYALGYMVLPGLALLVKDWRPLQLTLSAPGLALLSYYWLLPESPRWLATRGRLAEAADVLSKAADVSGNPTPPRERLLAALAAIHAKKKKETGSRPRQWRSSSSGSDGRSGGSRVGPKLRAAWGGCRDLANSICALVSTARLAAVTVVVFYLWFTAASTYYGISLYAVNLSTNQYLYLFLGGLLELPSYVLLWPLVSRFGRKKTNAGLYLTGGLSLLLLLLLQGLASKGPAWLAVAFSLLGKLTAAAAYQLAYLLTGELYPTALRSLAISLSSAFSSVGASCSSYINDLLVGAAWWAPAAVFASLSLLAAVLTAALPETTLAALPDSVADTRTLGDAQPQRRRQQMAA